MLSTYAKRFGAVLVCSSLLLGGISARADQAWTVLPDPMYLGSPARLGFPQSVLLPDGRVLLLPDNYGSTPGSGFYLLFDPVSESWVVSYNIPFLSGGLPRATLLQGGKVFVTLEAGSAYLYDPLIDQWSQAASMSHPRLKHSATRLLDGRVLVVGGGTGAEIYDPVANAWMAIPSPNGGSFAPGFNTGTLLADGRVLVVTSLTSANPEQPYLYDPATNAWNPTGPIPTISIHSATRVLDGRVLVVSDNIATLFRPATNDWTLAATPSIPDKYESPAVLLPDGSVMIVGTANESSCEDIFFAGGRVETYYPDVDRWAPAADLNFWRAGHSATLLSDGGILVAGGKISVSSDDPEAERFDASVVFAGGRGAVDGFASFGGAALEKTSSGFSPCLVGKQVPIVIYSAIGGETIFPGTLSLTFNGQPVTPVFPLPPQGLTYALVTLQSGRNTLLSKIDGIVPGTSRTSTDRDHLTFILP